MLREIIMDEDKVLIIMSTGPENASKCATPFFLATVAASMEKEVQMIFNINGGLLMKKGVAENLTVKEGGKPVSEFIEQAKSVDVQMFVCSPSLDLHDMSKEDLRDDCDGVVGGAYLLQEAAESGVVLNF
ncbi:MAG: DsrE/DsrF/DrsH-like family protein [Candidatus Heimdallarchaeota archaeon]|nr:DsrE/DsrF/DrsH-like family protein [Candidatus Heimdallarchaeota archaeon]MDH5645333.1 DsrE/DsrF/DrsH-like family protein [Candidatus Heimdallarchaeota archaeon]